jgi:phage repressor protein C with HTH and peptisase S24 domain
MASTRGERLKEARARRFKSARLAAKAMGIAVSTYGAHERAEDPGGRDYGPEEAKRYARFFRVTPEWLLTGRGRGPDGTEIEIGEPDPSKVPVVGYVGAGSKAHFYDVAQGDLDEVYPPAGSPESTVAVEVRGDSLGPLFNRWLVFYDSVHHEVTPDLIGEICVVGLPDGRVLIKQIQRGRADGLYNLISQTEAPIRDATVEWAARVNGMARRPPR